MVDATPRDALWASEQCLRAGCLSAVLSWPMQADDRALRRLQVAADTGGTMGFVFREARAERNPSPRRCGSQSTTRHPTDGPRNCGCSSAAAGSRLRVRFPFPSMPHPGVHHAAGAA
jgi:hypothetical protein